MHRIVLVPSLATAAFAARAQPDVDDARVLSVEPQDETVRVSRREFSRQWIAETCCEPPERLSRP